MRRCEVHLTASLDYADEIALRRGRCRKNTVILVIDARRMRDDGYVFHLSGDGTYLVKNVPVGYVEPLESRHPYRPPCASSQLLNSLTFIQSAWSR